MPAPAAFALALSHSLADAVADLDTAIVRASDPALYSAALAGQVHVIDLAGRVLRAQGLSSADAADVIALLLPALERI